MIRAIPHTKLGWECKRILHSISPEHRERIFLVCYLWSLGLSDIKILDIIEIENRWEDYDRLETQRQIPSLRPAYNRYSQRKRPPPTVEKFPREKGRGGGHLEIELSRFKGDLSRSEVLQPLNQNFLKGAYKIRFGILKNGREIKSPYPDNSTNALVNTFYRSIEGRGHNLFVVDIDREGDLERAYRDMLKVYSLNPHRWTWIKFSGFKGFHLIEKILIGDNGHDYSLLRERGRYIEDTLGIKIDMGMFQSNRLIRAFSINFKSGLCSIPINPDMDNLDDILLRAQTLELLANNTCLCKRMPTNSVGKILEGDTNERY